MQEHWYLLEGGEALPVCRNSVHFLDLVCRFRVEGTREHWRLLEGGEAPPVCRDMVRFL